MAKTKAKQKVRRMRDTSERMKVGVIDFFCGSGGVSARLQAVNGPSVFEIVTGVDNDPYCARTYERNIRAPCDQSDILALSNDPEALAAKVRYWKLGRFDKVLLVGCAPCQGFAAHRKFFAGDDPRRNLFEAFCRVASAMQADVVLMENVPDLFS